MQKTILLICLGAVAQALAVGSVWDGANGSSQITFGTTGGYWYSYSDETSSVSPLSANMATVIATQKQLPITFSVASGTAKYAAVGFDWFDNGTATTKTAVDLSGQTGLCVRYKSSAPVIMALKQLGIGDGCPNYRYVLPASSSVTGVNVPWSLFTAEGSWGGASCVYDRDLTKQVALHFQYKTAGTVTMTIYEVGFDGECTGAVTPSSSATSSAISSSSVQSVSSSGGASSVIQSSSAPVSSAEVVSSSSALSSGAISSSATVGALVWDGADRTNKIMFNGDGGYWYSYADPTSTVTPLSDNFLAHIEQLGYINATFSIAAGSAKYAAIGFDWVDNGVSAIKTPVDLSGRSGLCLTYSSNKEFSVALKQNGIGDGCPTYRYRLPAASAISTVNISWSQFASEGVWGGAECLYAMDLSKQDALHFQQKTAGSANLKLYKVGFWGDCGVPTISSSAVVVSSSSSSLSSIVRSSSSVKPSSSSLVSSAGGISSSSAISSLCDQPLGAGSQIPWKYMDDDGDEILNYVDPDHPVCYIKPTPVFGVVRQSGFGFAAINSQQIIFRTYEKGIAEIHVFGMDGKLLARVFRGDAVPGLNYVVWDGNALPNGVVLFRLTQEGRQRTMKAVLAH